MMFKRLIAMYIDLMIISFINAPLFYWLITGERSLLKILLSNTSPGQILSQPSSAHRS